MIRLLLIVVLGIAAFGLLNQHDEERVRWEKQIQTERNNRAAAELALAVASYQVEHDSLPATIQRTKILSYGTRDDSPFANFIANWPNVVLQDGPGVEPAAFTYTDPGFGIYAENGTDGHLYLIYWRLQPRNHRGK